MHQPQVTLTPERWAQGRTFEQYLEFTGSPENLQREGSDGAVRHDWTAYLRERYHRTRLTEAQVAAFRRLTSQPNGPAKILMIAEEWSSDCRRDLPVVQRLAEAGDLELRIFTRDGVRFGAGPSPDPSTPNADLVTAFLRRRDGETFQSIPVVAFFSPDSQLLYHYLEFPAVYHKDRIRGRQRAARPGETAEDTRKRAAEAFAAMLDSPMLDVWADAAVVEMISLLYERLVLSSLAE